MFRTGRRHKLTSEAGKRNERGVDPTICEAAADRVAELLAEHGGGTVEPGVTVVGTPPAPATITMPIDLPGPGHRHRRRQRDHDPRPAGSGLRGRRRRRLAHRRGAAVAARPHRPLRPRRGGGARRRVRRGALGAASGPGRPWAHPRAAAAPPHRTGRRGRRLHRGDQLPVRRRRGLRRPRPARRRRAASYRPAGQPALQRAPVVHHHAAAGTAAGDRAQPQSRCARGLAVRDRPRRLPHRPARPDLRRRRPAHRPGARGTAGRGARPAALPRRRGRRRAGARRLVGRRTRRASWADAVALVRDLGAELGVPVEVEAVERAPWHPGRCARVLVGETRAGPRRRAAPEGVRGLRPAASVRRRWRSTSTC